METSRRRGCQRSHFMEQGIQNQSIDSRRIWQGLSLGPCCRHLSMHIFRPVAFIVA